MAMSKTKTKAKVQDEAAQKLALKVGEVSEEARKGGALSVNIKGLLN